MVLEAGKSRVQTDTEPGLLRPLFAFGIASCSSNLWIGPAVSFFRKAEESGSFPESFCRGANFTHEHST